MDYSYPLYARDTGEVIGYLAPANYFDSQFWMLINSYLSDTRQSVVLGIAVTLLIAIIIGWFAARNLTKPLEKLTRSVRRIGQGAMNEKVNIENDDEIGELALAFNQMSSELSRANDARVQMFADISHELRTPITAIAGTLENKLVKNEVCEPGRALRALRRNAATWRHGHRAAEHFPPRRRAHADQQNADQF